MEKKSKTWVQQITSEEEEGRPEAEVKEGDRHLTA